MEPLADVLKTVEELEMGLNASIELTSGHFGYNRRFHTEERGVPDPDEEEVWIPDTKPDVQKRQDALTQLFDIYDTTPWCSARYAAAEALGMSVDGQFESWIRGLREQAAVADASAMAIGLLSSDFQLEGAQEMVQACVTAKEMMRQDLEHMYDSLPKKEHRKIAGEVLGYSDSRIWAHEKWLFACKNPLYATAAGFALAAGATGVGCAIAEYFSK